MQRATTLFTDEQRRQVEAAVGEAETKTSCEIVPVVNTASGRYDRPEDVVGLWFAVLTAIGIWYFFPPPSSDAGNWGGTPVWLGILVMLVGVVAAFLIGAILGSQIGWLRRLFTPKPQMQEEVASAARKVFFDNRIHHTSGSNGLLIYVSLFEHMAIVLADQDILDKLGDSFLDGLCRQLTQELHQGHPTEALCNVIAAAGDQLAGPLPRTETNQNELENTLILID